MVSGASRRPRLVELGLELIQDPGDRPFGFGDREPAGGKGGAGEREPPRGRQLGAGSVTPCCRRRSSTTSTRARVEIGEQQVLLSGEPHAGAEPGDDLVQRRLEPVARRIDDAPALNEDAVEDAPVRLAVAAEVVVKRQRWELNRWA